MDDDLYNRLETVWAPALQEICDRHAGEMQPVCVELQKQFLEFQKEKMALFSAMASVEGEEAALQAFTMRLDDMLPAYLQQLLTLTGLASIPVPENDNAVAESTPPVPVVSVQGPAAAKTLNDTAAMDMTMGMPEDVAPGPQKPPSRRARRTMASFFAPRQQDASTNPPPPALPKPRNTVQSRPALPTLSKWEVDGDEYLFQYAQFGPGWFVLRCDRGADTKPVTFTDPPLDKIGMRHFNASSCRYHDRSKTYTRESMMACFGRRIVDEDGEDVTDAWAANSNEMLTEKLEKRPKQKNRIPTEP